MDKSKTNPFNWENFENFFGANPVNASFGGLDISKLQDYIQKQLSRTFEDTKYVKAKEDYELFETHDRIITRLRMPEEVDMGWLKVYSDTHRVKVVGQNLVDQALISLPNKVRISGSKALFKDNVLEIHMLKEAYEDFQEIPVKFI